jgi:hypothetical protein
MEARRAMRGNSDFRAAVTTKNRTVLNQAGSSPISCSGNGGAKTCQPPATNNDIVRLGFSDKRHSVSKKKKTINE